MARPFVGEQMSTMPAEAGVARFTAYLSVLARLWKSSLLPATWVREYPEEQSIQFATNSPLWVCGGQMPASAKAARTGHHFQILCKRERGYQLAHPP